MKRAVWWELEAPTGVDPSWWTRLKVTSNMEGQRERADMSGQDEDMVAWEPVKQRDCG